MTAYGSVFFTMNEINRLQILQDVVGNRLTTRLAVLRLNFTDRHCRRLLEPLINFEQKNTHGVSFKKVNQKMVG
ncbi:hypothetical protein [Buttiauxella agrestis]|uniref:Transposase n=1 Tax=Buttiauxella agrestis ATCC 33320 TaxID=1006004 RepID=A0A085FYY0_9ENTR|nr:hypothetical protein [Buttiauxella agrestis]KFC76675.1 transposase [Buttiauxella agrestis ATCC 33320]